MVADDADGHGLGSTQAASGKAYYTFDVPSTPLRFVVLDTSYHRLRPAQLRWLRHVLETRLRKIIFTHMGPVQLGLWGGSIALSTRRMRTRAR